MSGTKRVVFTRPWNFYRQGDVIEPATGGLYDLLVNYLKVAIPREVKKRKKIETASMRTGEHR